MKMANAANQKGFVRKMGMHYMTSSLNIEETPEDFFHDHHLELQGQMSHPVAFHAEIIGNIMYFQQPYFRKSLLCQLMKERSAATSLL